MNIHDRLADMYTNQIPNTCEALLKTSMVLWAYIQAVVWGTGGFYSLVAVTLLTKFLGSISLKTLPLFPRRKISLEMYLFANLNMYD